MVATDKIVKIRVDGSFSVESTFDCGQCFRFDRDGAGGYSGIALGRRVRFDTPEAGVLLCEGIDEAEFESVWRHYLSLDTDYAAIAEDVCAHFPEGSVMEEAAKFGRGIRILRQEPFEALISFIISQNNNIPRIKGLISALCREAGEKIEGGYAFPSAEAILGLGIEGLRALKVGFRAPYIYDAAERVASGEISLEAVAACPTTAEASDLLCKIKGVGPKVAACTLLFGFGRMDAFPVDVWVKRSFAAHFGGSLDITKLGDYAGLAQQYLFYYERWKLGKNVENGENG